MERELERITVMTDTFGVGTHPIKMNSHCPALLFSSDSGRVCDLSVQPGDQSSLPLLGRCSAFPSERRVTSATLFCVEPIPGGFIIRL